MHDFMQLWHEAVLTSLGFFWMALWAFALGYLISSLIQVLVTHQHMRQAMGTDGPKSMLLGTFFGFISSSCSFAALATTRALFQKGAGLAPSMAFMLASTNLVIELGIVIAMFLGWQFVVGEYLGGLLLIVFSWLFIRLTHPYRLIQRVRERFKENDQTQATANQTTDWKQKISSMEGGQAIGRTYVMEWSMVWKDVLIGFTVAGIISAFVSRAFFEALFIGSGGAGQPAFWQVVWQALIGPVAAFFTFIGSMGNIPLAAVLYGNGVSFAGVMAFIFSDLVVLPVLRINARYYGWRMALYILCMLLVSLVVVSVLMHYGFMALDMLPDGSPDKAPGDQDLFKLNYTFYMNLLFLTVTAILGWFYWKSKQTHQEHHHHHTGDASITERIMQGLVILALIWLVGGLLLPGLY